MLGNLAVSQLAAWERLAETWPVTEAGRRLECDQCHGSILLVTDRHGIAYQYSPTDYLALIVLHLRNHHPHLDPDRRTQAL